MNILINSCWYIGKVNVVAIDKMFQNACAHGNLSNAQYLYKKGANIHANNNGNRYLRYKIYFDTASSLVTPNISDISFTFTSSCTPPGQVYFQGLSAGSYVLHLSKTDYVSQDVNIDIDLPWQALDVTFVKS